MKLLLNKNDMQSSGSAQSYARRYILQAMAFINSLDDDANKASGKKPAKKAGAPSFSKKESTGF